MTRRGGVIALSSVLMTASNSIRPEVVEPTQADAFAASRLMTKPLVQQGSPGVIFRLEMLRLLTGPLQSIRELRQRAAVQTRE